MKSLTVRVFSPEEVVDEPTNILVVDDLPENLLVYRTILEDLGQNLIMVGSGEEALRAVLNQDFAVILLDVKMPGMNGLETAALIRRRKRSSHTPIIFVTAFPDEVRETEGYAQGAVDYITTPVVPPILRAKVRVFTDLYRMTQQVRRQAEERVALAEERSRREAAEDANRRLDLLAAPARSWDSRSITKSRPGMSCGWHCRSWPILLFSFSRRVRMGSIAASRAATFTRKRSWRRGTTGLAAMPNRRLRTSSGVLSRRTPPRGKRWWWRCHSRVTASGSLFSVCAEPHLVGPSPPRISRSPTITLPGPPPRSKTPGCIRRSSRRTGRRPSSSRCSAHELRNPLAPIRSANEVLGMENADPERIRWAQEVIDRQLGHLVRLVDDLLDVSRLTLGKIRLMVEPVDLRAVIGLAVEAVNPLLVRSGHYLAIDLPPQLITLTGDKARLTQVLTNLINNACKYSDPGGRIELKVELEVPHAAHDSPIASEAFAIIRVRDTGIGIPADLLPRVFDPFTQANGSLDRSQGGLGIGLTLVRRLVEMHGGSVVALSDGPARGANLSSAYRTRRSSPSEL